MGVSTVAQRDERISLGHTACKLSGKDLFPGWFGFGQTWEELVGVEGYCLYTLDKAGDTLGAERRKPGSQVREVSLEVSGWLEVDRTSV